MSSKIIFLLAAFALMQLAAGAAIATDSEEEMVQKRNVDMDTDEDTEKRELSNEDGYGYDDDEDEPMFELRSINEDDESMAPIVTELGKREMKTDEEMEQRYMSKREMNQLPGPPPSTGSK